MVLRSFPWESGSSPEYEIKTPLVNAAGGVFVVFTGSIAFLMLTELIAPVLSFAVSTSITPGPNNVMVTASGANFGYRRTLMHILGISLGFPVMVVAVGLGLGGLFQALPEVHIVLKLLGCAYILWMAWKIATAGGMGERSARPGKPFTFLQAAGFQWVNPKAWVMAVGATAAFTSAGGYFYLEIVLIASIFLAVSFPCVSVWTLFGVGIGRILAKKSWLRLFNAVIALLLAASLIPVFIDWGS